MGGDGGPNICLTIAWALFTIAAAAISLYALSSPRWVESEDVDVACGPIAYCTNMSLTRCTIPGSKYGDSINNLPGLWWQAASVLLAVGATLLAMSFLGIVASIFGGSKTMRTTLHNCVCFAGILLFLGAILGLVGFKDLAMENDWPELPPGACRICNKNTAPFVLVDCNIGDGLIIAIVGCVLGAMASCIGYTNTPKKSAGS